MNLPSALTARLEAVRPEYRVLPHNIDAEQALLGAILVNNDAYHRVAAFLLPEHFMEEAHRKIFTVAGALIRAGSVATPITLKTYLGDADFGGQTVMQYLARLAADATTVCNAGAYARTIHDLAMRRRLITVGEELVSGAYEAPVEHAPRDLIEATEAHLLDLIDTEPGLASTAQSAAQSAAWMRVSGDTAN